MTSWNGNIFRVTVRGIHRSPVNSPHKGQWREDLVFSLICAWTNGWVNNRVAGDLRRHRAHYDVTVMWRQNVITHVQQSSSNPWPLVRLEAVISWLLQPRAPEWPLRPPRPKAGETALFYVWHGRCLQSDNWCLLGGPEPTLRWDERWGNFHGQSVYGGTSSTTLGGCAII